MQFCVIDILLGGLLKEAYRNWQLKIGKRNEYIRALSGMQVGGIENLNLVGLIAGVQTTDELKNDDIQD